MQAVHPAGPVAVPRGSRLIGGAARALGTAGALAFVAVLAIYQILPPAAPARPTSPAEFFVDRALGPLREIARAAHPTGSAEHDRVRRYLVERLRTLGCDVEVQTTTGIRHSPAAAGVVHNVLCRVRGSRGGQAVMLTAHYDGVPTAPAAGDDGAAVAALLETLRALQAGPSLRNDAILLFTDGEEDGLLGASAFVREHRWARDVVLVLNFEARGSTGPSLLFETTPGNGWLIRQVMRAAPHPVGSSLFYAIYRHLPNDTDFTIFRQAGWQGLNFAFVAGVSNYHTPRDHVDNLDRRSLAHHGEYALALLRHFGDLDLRERKAPDFIFFNLPGAGLVGYPESWSWFMLAVLCAGFALLVWLSFREHRLMVRSLSLGILSVLVALVTTTVSSSVLWWLIQQLHHTMLGGRPEDSSLYFVSFFALAVAGTTGTYPLLRFRVGTTALAFGSATVWLLLAAAVTLYLPAGSYLFQWPLAAALVAIGIMMGLDEIGSLSMISTMLLWLTAALPVAIAAPMIAFLYMGLGLSTISIVAITALVALTLWLLVPVLELLAAGERWYTTGVAVVTWLAFLLAGAMTVRYDRHHPRTNQVIYSVDADSASAKWATFDVRPDSWSVQFLTSGARREPLPALVPGDPSRLILQYPAPVLKLAPPDLKLVHDTTANAGRVVTLLLKSPRRARMCLIYVEGTRVLGARVSGKDLVSQEPPETPAGSLWGLQYTSLPANGAEIVLTIESGKALRVRVLDVSHGLPVLGTGLSARAEDMMESGQGDLTVVSRAYQF